MKLSMSHIRFNGCKCRLSREKHTWKWDTKEGRVTMLDSSIKSSGLELLKVEPMMFENALELKGELKFPDNFESLVAPKASGTLIKPTVLGIK